MKDNKKVVAKKIDIFVVIQDGNERYYLLKVEKNNFDVFCFIPNLGFHHSLHSSGESHFKPESLRRIEEQPPVIVTMGEAGSILENGIMCSSINRLGHASNICNVIFLLTSLSQDFRKFTKKPRECFLINKDLFSKDINGIEVGVWAVPARNIASFDFYNRDTPPQRLYKLTSCEPQIWICAKPF